MQTDIKAVAYTLGVVGGMSWRECLCMHVSFLLKDFPDIDFCVTLVLCLLRSALQVVMPFILSGIDETNDLTVLCV